VGEDDDTDRACGHVKAALDRRAGDVDRCAPAVGGGVEELDHAIVRHLVGYDRYASQAAYVQLARVYRLLRLHTNFFQPVQRLVHKTRHGARVHRIHDRAQTPFQRLCAAGVLAPTTREELEALYRSLNPLRLRRQIDAELAALWRLAAREPAPRPQAPVPSGPAGNRTPEARASAR